MRKLEKYYLLVLVTVTILVLVDVMGNLVFVALLWGLGLIYVIGGYWLFASPGQSKIISILSGVAFGVGLLVVPIGMSAGMGWVKVLLFSAPNISLFFFLMISALSLKYRHLIGDNLKLLLLRSGILIILTVFFATTPFYTWAHRRVYQILNQRNK